MPPTSAQSSIFMLMDHLRDVQRLSTTIGALIDEGLEEYEVFREEFDKVVDSISPKVSVAIAGPVSSGKSTIVSALLQAGGATPIASVSPSNETAAPMVFTYATVPRLTVHYFSVEVLQQVELRLQEMERTGGEPYRVALYKDIRNRLLRIDAVRAGSSKQNVVEMIELAGKTRGEIASTLKSYVAQSSERPEIDGVYKAELSFPSPVLRDIPNVRLVDMYGFGEPNPLVDFKFTRFISDENIDSVVYVFPGPSVTDDFHKLFELPGFVENIVRKGRLFLVLNKADGYGGGDPKNWGRLRKEFRSTLARLVPAMRSFVNDVPIFVMSAALIDSVDAVRLVNASAVRKDSIESLHALRDAIARVSREVQADSGDPALHFGKLFDVLGVLEALSEGVERNIDSIERRLPAISRSIDDLAGRKLTFDAASAGRLHKLRALMRERVARLLDEVDFESYVQGIPGPELGDPQQLFRWMIRTGTDSGNLVFQRHLVKAMSSIVEELNADVELAYGEYVNEQDRAAAIESEDLGSTRARDGSGVKPLFLTLQQFTRELPRLSRQTSVQLRTQALFSRFVNWFLLNRCAWTPRRGQGLQEVRDQVTVHLQAAVEAFAIEFFCCGARAPGPLRVQVCPGGEPSFWDELEEHIVSLEQLLGEQVKMTTWRFGLYRDRKYFVSRRPDYQRMLAQLRDARRAAEKCVVELT